MSKPKRRTIKPALPAKRGRGRPKLDPDGETVPLTIRVTLDHFRVLKALIAAGHGPKLADAVRFAIENAKGEAAKFVLRKPPEYARCPGCNKRHVYKGVALWCSCKPLAPFKVVPEDI